jgi:hypothetical protein
MLTDDYLASTDAPPRVKFGPRPDDDMPVTWAERLLTWLKSERPNVFADGMLVVFDVERKRGRS